MKTFLALIISSLMVIGFSHAFVARAEKEVYHEEPDQDPVEEKLGGYVESHPYLQGDLYEEIANLDLSANEESPSISMIESNTDRCIINDGGVVGLDFEIPSKSLSRDLTHSELVISLKDSDDAVSLLSSYVRGPPRPDKELDEEPPRGQPRLNNNWLVYDVSDILKAFDSVDQQSGTVTVSVELVGLPTRNGTVEFDACGRYSTKPPTVFLYHNFPGDLRQSIHRSSAGGIRRKRQLISAGSRTAGDQGSACHLHQYTVDFHQIGMKWIIAPILFQINYCHGVCNAVINQTDIRVNFRSFRASPHAKMIARAKASLPQTSSASLPSLSCVPITYDIMNMIYIDRNSIVRVETFSQMVASTCGCA